MKRFYLFFVLLTLFFFCSNGSKSPNILKIKKVVIDAGHGGEDPGAIGKKSKEKNIALSVALKLGTYIKTNFPDIEVIYTRKTDVFIELFRRAQIANNNKADLFISIHCNSTAKPDAYGTETWVLGLNKSQANLEVAKKENASVLFEKDYTNQYDGFDPNSPEGNIIFSLYQNAYLDQSLQFAGTVEKQFSKKIGRHDRGVKQAGFLVLYRTTMPGALIELGFLSNPQEEEYLLSDNGQIQIASSIYRAFKEYKTKYEGGVVAEDEVPDFVYENQKNSTDSISHLTVKDTLTNPYKPFKKEVFFRVQFATSPTKRSLNSAEFKDLSDVRFYFHNKTFKYTTGNYTSIEEAINIQHEIQKKGHKDAFVVAFLNGERITPEEAAKLLKQ
jgi:N-acetylmuramoyl-L-alanine amidase